MKLVTFGIDSKRNLIMQFPVFVQPYTQERLKLCTKLKQYQSQILDENEQVQSYTQLKIDKPYITLNTWKHI